MSPIEQETTTCPEQQRTQQPLTFRGCQKSIAHVKSQKPDRQPLLELTDTPARIVAGP